MRNYDTTNFKPYPRVTEVNIIYPKNGVPSINYVELMAIVDADGNVQHLNDQAIRYELDLSRINEPVQIIDPSTGENIEGQFSTKNEIMLGILAFLRADQVIRDSE